MIVATWAGVISFRHNGAASSGREGKVISSHDEGAPAARTLTALLVRSHLWTLVAAVALIAGSGWLRTPSIRYLVAALAATALAALVAVPGSARARRWALAAVAGLLLFCAVGFMARARLDRIDLHWPAYRAALITRGVSQFQAELAATTMALRRAATAALDVPTDGAPGFRALARIRGEHADRGLVLFQRGQPAIWSGRIVTMPDTFVAPIGAHFGPFYVTLYAAAVRGESRAVATAVLNAVPPGDGLTTAIGTRIATRVGLDGFELYPRGAAPGDAAMFAYAPGKDTVLLGRAVAPGRDEARLLVLEDMRNDGAVILGVTLLLYLIAAWRQEETLVWRLAPLGVALAAVALMPLTTFSSVSALFDPTVYYATIGGPLTANAAALIIAAALVLVGLMLAVRSRARIPSRRVALVLVLAILGGGLFLLRALSRGVAPPPGGVSTPLWLAWELALFLVAAALLIGAATAGGALLGRGRGLPPWMAPLLAALLAVLGPIVLIAPGEWPRWYALLWIVTVCTLAFSTPSRRQMLWAATVAALGAATLTWNAGIRGRAALANRDVSGLGVVEPEVNAVLNRLADAVPEDHPPMSTSDLVRLYMQSDLVGTGYPVQLRTWPRDSTTGARVALDPITLPLEQVEQIAAMARRTCDRVIQTVLGDPGVFVVLAIPSLQGDVTTVIVAPRTRLIPDNPYNALLGIEPRESGPPPYLLSLADVDPATPISADRTRWYRNAGELHGDRLVHTARGATRAHIDITLGNPTTLVQRGTLVVLLDLVIIAMLWALSAFPAGVFLRWTRTRTRRWSRSFRARLTLVLFGFFVLPAVAFALWSYQRLQSEDAQSRALLVREALRSYVTGDTLEPLTLAAGELGMPLLVFRNGELREASDPLFKALAPIGRFMSPAVYQTLGSGREVSTSRMQNIGGTSVLFGYLAAMASPGQEVVYAAAAHDAGDALDQRRRDLGILVLFVTVLGAMGALWLSQVASSTLAEPIASLRGAALKIAAGEREPPLTGRPPIEFAPVFSAFRRMAADLGASRTALESAQRRTADVLRNVASGVVALSADGKVVLANPQAESLLGLPLPAGADILGASEEIARRVRDFLSRDESEEAFELAIAERQVQARFTRLSGSGAAVVLTLDDVTDLARAQRVLAWGEMARQVAHEIKNPLTPIRLGVQHLKRAYGDARLDFDLILDRNVTRILAEIDRLDEIARGFSRYGTAPAERAAAEPVDVMAIARDVMDLERLGREDVEWITTGCEEPVHAMASGEELREVLLNVLENARLADATRVELRCARGDGRVIVEVADNGHGIARDVLPRIFEPHFSTRTSGSGLGLAISRQLVDGWGGAMAIASSDGEGTVVRIELREPG